MTVLCVICNNRERDPDYGQCCPLCPSRLARRLAEIPGLAAELHALGYVQRDYRGERRDEQGRVWRHFDQIAHALPAGPINGTRSAPRVSGSATPPVPIRIDPTDLLARARAGSTSVHVSSRWPEDQIGHLAVATELDFWVRDWAEQRGEGLPSPDPAALAGWLWDRIDWAVRAHPALDEMAETVRRIHGALMGALGLFAAPPKAMEAPCRNPDCEGAGSLTLFQEYPGARVECSMCTALLSEDEYAEYVRGEIRNERRRRAVEAFSVRTADLRSVNSMTKYPSIPTYHALDPRTGGLLDEVVEFRGPVIATEKVDGTNSRIIYLPDGSWLLGSREELLYAEGDLIGNPALGIVEALKPVAESIDPGGSDMIRVFYLELYGGKIGGQSKQYTTDARTVGWRLFDVATIDWAEVDGWSSERISRWRDGGGQDFLGESELHETAALVGLELTPRLFTAAAADLPTGIEETADLLGAQLPGTLCALDDSAKGAAEGIVFRSADRSVIAKARFQDYERTLKRRKATAR